MAQTNKLSAIDILSITCYNGSGTAIDAGYCVATDPSYDEATYGAPGVKLTTGSSDFFGITRTSIPASGFGSVQVLGVAVGLCSAAIAYGTVVQVMSDSAGKLTPWTTGLRSAGVPLSTTSGTGEYVRVFLGGNHAT
jgi:hypothetical protein